MSSVSFFLLVGFIVWLGYDLFVLEPRRHLKVCDRCGIAIRPKGGHRCEDCGLDI